MKTILAVTILALTCTTHAQQLPDPGVVKETPVAVETPRTANYWELAHFDTSNREGGIVVDVWWNAYTRTADDPATPDVNEASRTLVKNFGPVSFSGAGLAAIAADAFARAKAHELAGRPPGVAYMMGQRDAIYAALKALKQIPE